MTSSKLAVAALTAAVVLAGAALAKKRIISAPPAPKRPAALAPVSDPAEPPMTVGVFYDVNPPGRFVARTGRDASVARTLTVAGSARGATLTLDTPGWYKGWATLTFKGAAPPMRLTMRLARLQELDLEKLTVSSGRVSLHVGRVTATPSTRYFDAAGREQKAPERAAYTVTTRRWGGGEVDVEVRRAPGASLGRELTVNWRGDLGWGDFDEG
jgi:hypothetical protein